MTTTRDHPDEFQHLLARAETACRAGRHWEVMTLYDQAIELAHNRADLEQEALAQELAARFWLTRGKSTFAVFHLEQAYTAHLLRGAKDKAAALEQAYPHLLADPPDIPLPQQGLNLLDLATVMAVAQTISGEIILEKLITKLMKVILESMGAERGCLLLDKANQWVIEAEVTLAGEVSLFQSRPVKREDGSFLLPVSIINHVAQCQKTIVLPAASTGAFVEENRFAQDPYILTRRPQSLLCTPFLNQIKSTGILYLENSFTSGAFTPQRLEILALLASQAVISIETAILYSSLESALEKQTGLTNAYSRFVPREILRFLGKDSITQVKLGDQTQQEMTLLFSDIRSFTSLSEEMTPQENFNFINAYLSRVSPIIRKHNGFIDKYIGDAIMALFPGPADEAVAAAIGMHQEVTRFNLEGLSQQPIRIGVGLHRGSVMLGTVGEARRMEGTVISDAVNLASRLEGLTKRYGASIVISEQTLYSLECPARYNFRFLDKVKVKGKTGLVSVFEIFDGDPQELIDLKLKTRPDFEKGLLHYHSQEFREAIGFFNNVLELNPEDRAAQVYLRQATHCLWIGWEKVKILTE